MTLVVLLVAALIGGGVWFFMNHHKNDENLTLAEKYMDRGDFDKALSYYEKAAEEAKDRPRSMRRCSLSATTRMRRIM